MEKSKREAFMDFATEIVAASNEERVWWLSFSSPEGSLGVIVIC